jgi:hypothetical protein
VFRTDQDGSLFFRTDGDRYQLQTAADFRPERAFSETGFLLSEKRNWLRTIGFVPLF